MALYGDVENISDTIEVRNPTGNRTVRSACRARRRNLPCLSGSIAAGGAARIGATHRRSLLMP